MNQNTKSCWVCDDWWGVLMNWSRFLFLARFLGATFISSASRFVLLQYCSGLWVDHDEVYTLDLFFSRPLRLQWTCWSGVQICEVFPVCLLFETQLILLFHSKTPLLCVKAVSVRLILMRDDKGRNPYSIRFIDVQIQILQLTKSAWLFLCFSTF